MKRYKSLISIILCLSLIFSIVTPTYAMGRNNSIKPLAWPGRPGGNGDGSEEWLSGNYGETNGPWRQLPYYPSGKVHDLIYRENVEIAIGAGIISFLSAGIFTGPASMIAAGVLSAGSVGIAVAGSSYEGNYYKTTVFISGRCMKIEIRTYEYSNFTGYIKTYTRYVKW